MPKEINLNSIPKDKKIYISVTITDDKEIQTLNKQFKNKDKPTDVLSFNINEELEDGTFYLGDVVVSKEQADRQSEKYGNNLEQEISELVAHGTLHLLGVHHEEHEEDETKDTHTVTDTDTEAAVK